VSPQSIEAAWRSWEGPGLDHLLLRVENNGVEADGVVLTQHDGAFFRARYKIRCDPGWGTRELILDPLDGRAPLHLLSDGEGRWRDAAGRVLRDSGRLRGRPADAGRSLQAALHLPGAPGRRRSLQVRGQGHVPGFTADLPVDADGLVLDYPGIFRRIS
jgi:hypothetical protein